MSSGVRAEGQKYNFLREEDAKTVYAKKKDLGAITAQASKTAVVIGHCPEGSQQGNLNKGVAVIAEYLESLNMQLATIQAYDSDQIICIDAFSTLLPIICTVW